MIVQPRTEGEPQTPDLAPFIQEKLIPSHDWYQTEKHIVILIYTKRTGIT